jgi:hypothetical protein
MHFTWSFIFRDEQRLRVFENRVLSRILGHKKEEVLGGWINLYEELDNSYFLPNIIGIIKSCRVRWLLLFV